MEGEQRKLSSFKRSSGLYISLFIRKWKSYFFLVSILILLGAAIYQAVSVGIDGSTMTVYKTPVDIYISWIGGGSRDNIAYWYYFLGPFIALAYFVISFSWEREKGYLVQTGIRLDRKHTALVRGIYVFIGSAAAFIVPELINMAMIAVIRPALLPKPLVAIGPASDFIGAGLYYTHPLVYILLYILFDGLAVGTMGLIGAVITLIADNGVVSMGILFGIYYLLFLVAGFTDNSDFSPAQFLIPGTGLGTVWPLILISVIAIVCILIIVYSGERHEDI